jgi:hypothetical protein
MKLHALSITLFISLSSLATAHGAFPADQDSLLRERMRREDYFNRIDRKLETDISATRVWKLALDTASFPLARIPAQGIRGYTSNDSGACVILFVVNEEAVGGGRQFEVIPLAIRRTTTVGAGTGAVGVGRAGAGGQHVTEYVVRLKDIARLDSIDQQKVVEYIVDNIAKATAELDIKPESKPTPSVSPFNRDFWSFAKATSHHMVPLLERAGAVRVRRLNQGGSTAPGGPVVVGSGVTASFSLGDTNVTAFRESVDVRSTLTWPEVTGVRVYRVTVATDTGFNQPVFQDSSQQAKLTRPMALEAGKEYWCRLQNAEAPATERALLIKPFRTKARVPGGADSLKAAVPSDRLGYSLDFSLSRITLAHELLYSESALGIPGFGVEVNFDNPILGLLPYKSPAMTWGGRLLLNTTGDKKDVLDRDFLELKLMARTRFDCQKFYDGMGALRYLFTPLASSESPQLNVAAPGFAVEVATSRWWNLPYLNFYVSTGSEEYSDPVFSKGEGKDKYAYWSTSQWRGSMSFYFNLDSEPEFYLADALRKRLNIVRLDIGAGTYNVARIGYDTAGNMASKVGVIKTSRIQPYLSVEYVHASQVKTSFGIRSSYFDNRIFLSAWLSLFKIGYHELRLEGTNILGPFGRAKYEWEASGGTMLQFRYRLGF